MQRSQVCRWELKLPNSSEQRTNPSNGSFKQHHQILQPLTNQYNCKIDQNKIRVLQARTLKPSALLKIITFFWCQSNLLNAARSNEPGNNWNHSLSLLLWNWIWGECFSVITSVINPNQWLRVLYNWQQNQNQKKTRICESERERERVITGHRETQGYGGKGGVGRRGETTELTRRGASHRPAWGWCGGERCRRRCSRALGFGRRALPVGPWLGSLCASRWLSCVTRWFSRFELNEVNGGSLVDLFLVIHSLGLCLGSWAIYYTHGPWGFFLDIIFLGTYIDIILI